MNDTTLHELLAPRDDTNTPDVTAQAHTPGAPPANGDLAAALADALIATGALDAHIERIIRHVLAEYDAQQNVYARRAGGYRPGAFGSIG